MPKKISMQDIADRLGVSKYTVSQALSGKSGVSRGVRLQIIELARTLGYRLPSASPADPVPPATIFSAAGGAGIAAASPASGDASAAAAATDSGASPAPVSAATPPPAGGGSRGTCAADAAAGGLTVTSPRLLVYMEPGYMGDPDFWSRVLDGLLVACRVEGWAPGFLEHAPRGSLPVTKAESAPAEGLIIVGKTSTPKLLALRQLGLPTVLIDHEEPLIEADVILNANLEAARTACNHLLAQGCASIVFAGRDSYAVSFKERWWGCRLALDEWKHAHRDAPVQLKKWSLPYGSPGWRQQLAKRLESMVTGSDTLPDGFLCANDQIALQLIEELRTRGISIPDRCRIVGIDNITISAGASPPLTTVELAKEPLGRRAVQALERRLRNSGALSEKIILSARLIVRQSG